MAKNRVPEPFASALLLQDFLEKHAFRFCIIGGLAVARWGRIRATQDADVSLFTGFEDEERIIDRLLSHFEPRRPDTREFALQYRILLLNSPTKVGLDIALAGLPFEERAIERSSYFEFIPGASLRTCSAEDLLVYKAFAGRGTDWDDCESIIEKQKGTLNIEQILSEISFLASLKEEPEIVERLAKMLT